jgi:DNA-binding transcriptional regulator YiaG
MGDVPVLFRIMNRERIGSKLDSMFEDLGELEEVRILTQKKIIARQLEQARQAGKISISEMARRMGTSRMHSKPKRKAA